MTIQEQILKVEAESRFAAAKAEKSHADVEYVAMMADIDIPTEDNGGEE